MDLVALFLYLSHEINEERAKPVLHAVILRRL